jgi:hypothetical protein
MKWAVWIPWEGIFRPDPAGESDLPQLFDDEQAARTFCGEGRQVECIHGFMPPGCEDCWWQARPWDSTAEQLHRRGEMCLREVRLEMRHGA